jgi:hypothetical protein
MLYYSYVLSGHTCKRQFHFTRFCFGSHYLYSYMFILNCYLETV